MYLRRVLIVLTLLLPVSHLTGQEFSEKNFDCYTKAEGLSHSTVNGIAQDSAGYVWIATASGLNRFDGSRFVQLHSNNERTSLPAEDLLELKWLDRHRLAISTDGLHIIDTRTGETRNVFIPYRREQYQYKFNMLLRATGDDQGNTYILSRSGFYHFDKNYNLIFRFDYYSDKEVLTEHFYWGEKLLELDSQRLLIVSMDKLYVYEKKRKQFKKLEAADCPAMAEFLTRPAYFYLFFQQKPGNLFVLKAEHDTLVYVNTIENKKMVSRLPFNPIASEFGWRTRLIPVSDTVFYITGHNSVFF